MAICQPQKFLDRQKIVYERNQAYEKKVVVGFRKIQSGEQPYLPDFPDFSGLSQKYISAWLEFKLAEWRSSYQCLRKSSVGQE